MNDLGGIARAPAGRAWALRTRPLLAILSPAAPLTSPYIVNEAAGHVDKILREASPAEVPIGRAGTFELVVNRKTAKALGVTLPQELILGADEVME